MLDHFPIRAPLGVALRGDVEATSDGHSPIGAAVRFVRLQALEELVCTRDDTHLAYPRNRAMNLEEAHPDVESEAPVGGEGDDARIDEELVITLVEKGDVFLYLSREVVQRVVAEACLVAVAEGALVGEKVVAPMPFVVSERGEVHGVGVGVCEFTQHGHERVPGGRSHVR